MKIEKKNIYNAIEEIIGNGVLTGEEIDITTTLIMREIWKIIQYQKDENKALRERIKYLEKLTDTGTAGENGS